MMKTAREILNKLGGYDWDVDEALRDLDALVPKKIEDKDMPEHENKHLFDLYKNGYNYIIDKMHKIFKGGR